MQLTKVLERLSKDEFAELLARWGLEDDGKVSLRAVADSLAKPHVLPTAFRHLDAFQLKLFRWILRQRDYEAPWTALQDAIGDRVPATYLEQELQDARLWGLLDFRAAPDGVVGTYPAAAAAFPLRSTSLREQLGQVVSDNLRQICLALQIKNAPTIKEGRLTAIIGKLSDPDQCRAVVDSLPAASRTLFDWVRGRGSKVSTSQLSQQQGGSSARQMYALPNYYHPYNQRSDPLHDLTSRALLLPVSDYPSYSYSYYAATSFVVPEEVERALTGGSFFDDGPLQPPQIETAEDASGSIPNPLHLVRDLGHLLGFVASGRCEFRQDREPYQRSLTAFGKAVKHPDKEYPAALWALATTIGMLYAQGYQSEGYAAMAVEAPSPAIVARAVVETWAVGGPSGLPDLTTSYGVTALRQSLLGLLVSLPTDVWMTRASVLRHLEFRRPLFFAAPGSEASSLWPTDWDTMRYLVYAAGTTSKGEATIMVPAAVRPFFPSQDPPDADALPPWDDTRIIQPDRTIIVPPNVPPNSLRALWQVAELEDNQGAAIFRLTAASVARALNQGMTPAEVEATLRRGSKTDLPNTVERLLQDQGKRYGQIKLGSALTYVRAEDPAMLEALIHDRKLGHLKWRLLAPGVAVVDSAAPTIVLETLRKAGHLPVMDDAPPVADKMTPEGTPAKGPPAGPLVQDPAFRQEIEELVSGAIEEGMELALKWKQDGRTRTATVLPYALKRGILAAEGRTGRDYEIPLDAIIHAEEIDYFDDEEVF